MARTSPPVLRALNRWVEKGLLTRELAITLNKEVEEEARSESVRWFQYLLAATGGAVLIVAGSTFLALVWPELGYAGQSAALALIGLSVLGLGVRLPKIGRLAPVAYLLQLAGTVLILMAFIHSEEAWEDGTLGGWGVGLAALVMPVGLLYIAIKDRGILAGLQAALSFLFLFVFLDRALGLSEESILWILDGVLVGVLGLLAFKLRDSKVPRWALGVFFTLLLSSIVLIGFSSDLLWDLESKTIYPMDLWLITVAGLCIWGLQEDTPSHLRREWYEHLLALSILVAIGFAFLTTLEGLDTGPTAAAAAVAAIGVLGLWYGLPRHRMWVAGASCVALLIAAWYWGAEMSGALGAVLALLAVSAILFWSATRIGRGLRGGDETGNETGGDANHG